MALLGKAREARIPLMKLIRLKGVPILEQLYLEERLLRIGSDNCCLINDDYVFGDCKFGGNAQSIIKRKWVHHMSFLWDYDVKNMTYLKLPAKAPNYRLAREHTDFVCKMKEFLDRSEFIERTIKAIRSHFSLEPVVAYNSIVDIEVPSATTNFTPSTRLLTHHDMRGVSTASL